MPSWVLVPCLIALRQEFNELAPSRDKTSDGSIGDSAHANSSSDHNPDETGATPYEDSDNINEVHAIDVDVDLNKPGWDMQKCVNILVSRHREGQDGRLQNVIYNRTIWSASWGWTAREYTGSNPHDKHAHFSSKYTTAAESNVSPWGLLTQSLEGVMLPTFGDSGEDVAYWQRIHNWVRSAYTPVLPELEVDGDYGPATRAAFTAHARANQSANDYVSNALGSWQAVRYHRDFIQYVAG